MLLPIIYFLVLYSCMSVHADSQHLYCTETQQLPFVIHICSYNNRQWVEKNLDSVFMQKYDNFRVIYVDDNSMDGTADAVNAYIAKNELQDRVTLFANKERNRKIKNMYSTIRLCEDHEIIVQVDGDDWLCDDQLLARLNHIYQTQDVWLTYGSYTVYPSGERGYCEKTPSRWVEKKLFRKKRWLYMHPRSFYAWLFKAIKVQDLLAERVEGYQGLFFPASDDLVSFWPMLEMAGERFRYLHEITYICNRDNPLSGLVVENPLQRICGHEVSKSPTYATCKEKVSSYTGVDDKVDIIVVLSSNQCNRRQVLLSLQKHIRTASSITIFDGGEGPKNDVLEELCGGLSFEGITVQVHDNLVQILERSLQNHILLVHDTVLIVEDIDIKRAIFDLETTYADGVYFAFALNKEPFCAKNTLDQGGIPFVHLYDDVYAWKFSCGKYAYFNNYDMTLFRKKDLLDRCKRLALIDQEEEGFQDFWRNALFADLRGIGLFYRVSPVGSPISTAFAPIETPRCLTLYN